jgi:two-component system, LytTR family, response regulator
MPVRRLSILVVDDDLAERSALVRLCEQHADLCVVGQAGSGAEAVSGARNLRPDLIVLDHRLPDMNGFEVLKTLPRRFERRTILLTESSRESSSAIASGVLDCLVKPVRADAFASSVSRAIDRRRLRGASPADAEPDLRPEPDRAAGAAGRPVFLVGERERCLFPIDPANVDFIQSAGNYVKYRVGRVEYIAREYIKQLDELLQPLGFLRIERSLILNIRSIAYAEPTGHGTFAFTLVSGARLQSGYGFRANILEALPLRGHAARRNGKVVSRSPV